jgi:RNA polymerase sigma factor (sigma-70 family)
MLALGHAELFTVVLNAGRMDWPQDNAAGGLRAVLLDLRPELLRFLVARGAGDDAEDLLQDLYLKLDRPLSGPIADPRAYLYRMADNLLLDRRRSAARRVSREDAWTDAYGGGSGTRDDRPTAENVLAERQRLELVSAALSSLPERTVTIFRRFRIDGEPQKAIAADLGISVSAVEKHLQRAYRVVIDIQRRCDAGLRQPDRP